MYGATGAGKTYTMLGTEENPGVMFLTMVNLFERMEELKQERDIEMAVSYLEVSWIHPREEIAGGIR